MKKFFGISILAMAVCLSLAVASSAVEVSGTLLIQMGITQRNVTFPFTTPNLENFKVFRYERGSRFFQRDGVWKEIPPLTNVPQYGGHSGYYRFENGTSTVIQINGTPHEAKTSISYMVIDRVDDLGLFSDDDTLNDYGLPEKSNFWEYLTLNNVSGNTVYPWALKAYFKEQWLPSGEDKLVAFLIATDDGAWSRFYLHDSRQLEYMSFDDNDIVALIIYRGENWREEAKPVIKKIRRVNKNTFGVNNRKW